MTTEHISPADFSAAPASSSAPEQSVYGNGQRGVHVEVKPVAFGSVAPSESISPPAFLKAASASEAVSWWPAGSDSSSQGAQQPEAGAGEEPLSEALAARVETACEEARQEGFEAGREEGLASAAEEVESRVQAELEALKSTQAVLEQKLKELAVLRSTLLEQAESDALALIFSVAKRLAGEAQLHDTEWVEPLLKEASKALTDSDGLTVKVAPELAERLGGAEAFELQHNAQLIIDPELSELDMVVETRTGRVDASFEERLDNLKRAVSADLQARAREGGPQ